MSLIEDEIALRNLMARYIDAVNRSDAEAWASTWTADATWHLMGNAITPRETIVATWTQVMASFDFALLMPSSCLFDIQGDSASGHWYLHEYTRDANGAGTRMLSRYQDSYRRVDGQWLYQSREYQIMYREDANLSGDFIPVPQ
jgi:ketosteroid isomerase-like protein